MAVVTKKISQWGKDFKISEHFTLGEFACKDGTDTVLYSTDLLKMLENLRLAGNFIIHINSGYRTPSYNKKIGGASRSKHTEGYAADIVVKKDGVTVDARIVCCLCQTLGFKGIGYISVNATHVDMRPVGTYRGDERGGYGNNVKNFYEYFNISDKKIAELFAYSNTQNSAELTEEEEMVYKDITAVPEWGRKSVQLRIDHGWSDGKNLTESMVRDWVIYDRENPYIVDLNDVPQWAIPETEALIAAGVIKGNGVEPIGKRLQQLEVLIMSRR